MSKLLSRDEIRVVQDAVFEEVEVPEWGGTVRVKALSGAERDAFESSLTEQKGKKIRMKMQNVRARMARLTCVDENGKPVFQPSDEHWLGEKSAAALDRVFDVAMKLAGMRDEDIDELTENFTEGQSDDSISV
jgi:hypothetical protein